MITERTFFRLLRGDIRDMMVKASNRERELINQLAPWLITSEKEGEPAKLKPNVPEEIKKAYEEWLKL